MKIAIFGGSFDPPHIGHILIAREIKNNLNIDQVWLMPNHTHAFGKSQSPSKKRFDMTMFLAEENIIVSDFEIKSKGISYTIDTLNALKKLHPKDKFYWVLGSDQLESFHKYKSWREIVNKYPLIVYPRESVLTKLDGKVKRTFALEPIPSSIIVMQNDDLILTNISSSMIRKRVKKNQSIRYLVPESVVEYIRKYKLYK